MHNYNPNIHHRKSIRLRDYDYSRAGLYYITICVHDRKCLFGKIENDKMVLNNAGNIANECWMQIPEHFPNSVLYEHVVMPNHIHGIIELVNMVGVENFQPRPSVNKSPSCDGVENIQPRPSPRNEYQKMIPHSICSIVKGFKIGVTKWFRNNTDVTIVWQRNYYEHIIRSKNSCERIYEYIKNNPINWRGDRFYQL